MKNKLKHKTLWTIVAYLTINSFFSFSQDRTKVDSLENIIKTTNEDTTRIKALNKLAWKLKSNNPDTAIYYSKQALAL
ncbi:MAG: hypothetical protein QQN41_06360, partial [Nitrosopumilus sp.]